MTLILVFILWILSQSDKQRIDKRKTPCRQSTISNPWSSLLPHSKDPEAKACKESRDIIENNMYYGFLRDQDDDIQREKMNPFITPPVTSILGEDDKFANFQLYGYKGDTCFCKRDLYGCERYRDLRFDF